MQRRGRGEGENWQEVKGGRIGRKEEGKERAGREGERNKGRGNTNPSLHPAPLNVHPLFTAENTADNGSFVMTINHTIYDLLNKWLTYETRHPRSKNKKTQYKIFNDISLPPVAQWLITRNTRIQKQSIKHKRNRTEYRTQWIWKSNKDNYNAYYLLFKGNIQTYLSTTFSLQILVLIELVRKCVHHQQCGNRWVNCVIVITALTVNHPNLLTHWTQSYQLWLKRCKKKYRRNLGVI